jgi:aminomethyltransferase
MARRTPLHATQAALGARFVDFAGWEMPVSFAGPAEEHRAVRERCGLFDVSHMGEVEVRGPGAAEVCQTLTVNDVRRLADGAGQYSVLCDERGGVLDDLIVFRLAADRWLLVVNAANAEADLAWIVERARGRAEIVDRSAETALLAFQGPRAVAALEPLADAALAGLPSFHAAETRIAGRPALVTRTGYTGEDGVEIMVAGGDAAAVWNAVLDAARTHGGLPTGLAARDTLRLEAALPLCGSDMDRTTTPLEAGLGWVVKLGKGAFVGRDALAAQAEGGVPRRLVGIELDEPGVPRHGHTVWRDDAEIGTVTSGTKSPTLGRYVGLAYVGTPHAVPGTPLAVDIRGRRHRGRVVQKPFYRRPTRQKE